MAAVALLPLLLFFYIHRNYDNSNKMFFSKHPANPYILLLSSSHLAVVSRRCAKSHTGTAAEAPKNSGFGQGVLESDNYPPVPSL